jgi:hypothetical protein
MFWFHPSGPSRARPLTRPPLRLEPLERRLTPAPLIVDTLAVGAGTGALPHVRVFNVDGTVRFDFFAYDTRFIGGVRVATGDVTGDGIDDLVTAAGVNGGPHVKVFDGFTGTLVREFNAYDPLFIGGVFVGTGDVNRDGFDDVITGAGQTGGPHVKVFSGATNAVLASFFAYDPAFRGGVTVAGGDVNGDLFDDIITGAGPGGGPHVQAFDADTQTRLLSFFAFPQGFRGGVFVASGDVRGTGIDDVITGPGQGGGPNVAVYAGTNGTLVRSFFAFGQTFTGGVRVAAIDSNRDGRDDLVAGPGPGASGRVRIFDNLTLAVLSDFIAINTGAAGIYVG